MRLIICYITEMMIRTILRPLIPIIEIDAIFKHLPRPLLHKVNSFLNPHWYKGVVGGKWDEQGERQFNHMCAQGLGLSSYLLDIGCGSLRAGLWFISYLDEGHYYGIDISEELLNAGRNIELPKHNLQYKNPTLVCMDDFNFESLGQTFDYVLAQSVFTHLPERQIARCITNVEKVLRPNGKFFATFAESPSDKEPVYIHKKSYRATFYYDGRLYFQNYESIRAMCDSTRLSVSYIGDWGHPGGQKMLVFTKQLI